MGAQVVWRRLNVTPVSSFVLSAYINPGSLRWLSFSILLLLFLLMMFANVLLLCAIALSRDLHQPMYMFLCSLFVNELYGSAALYPFLLAHILRDDHTVGAHFCFFQIFVLHGYGWVEVLTLAAMSYDRFASICDPLHYKTRMSRGKMTALLVFPWVYAFAIIGNMTGLTSSLTLCGNVINKVYCDNYSIIKLACYDTTSSNLRGIVFTVIAVTLSFMVISYTYFRILVVCWRGSAHTRQKAVHTCSPQLASVLNFMVGACFEVFQGRFDMRHVPIMLRIFLSLYFFLCQPLFNPLIYGLVLTKMRLVCKGFLLRVPRKGL